MEQKHQEQVVSPSRTYVAVCNKLNFDGHYFRKFRLPERSEFEMQLENNASFAAFYFLNRFDRYSSIEGCVTAEDFENVLVLDEHGNPVPVAGPFHDRTVAEWTGSITCRLRFPFALTAYLRDRVESAIASAFNSPPRVVRPPLVAFNELVVIADDVTDRSRSAAFDWVAKCIDRALKSSDEKIISVLNPTIGMVERGAAAGGATE